MIHTVTPFPVRAEQLLQEQFDAIHRRTDRMFAYLMILQWVLSLVGVLLFSFPSWNGGGSHVNRQIWTALIAGGCLTAVPTFFVVQRPGTRLTRHVIAVAQMMWSALLIHLTGGRIESHFHVFGSLAVLACYRDWQVLVTATMVVVCDHIGRGVFWPQALHEASAFPFRTLEQVRWVLFEDVFLAISMRHNVREMSEIALNQSRLEETSKVIEFEITARTRGFGDYTDRLEFARRALEKQAVALEKQSNELREARASAESASRAKSEFLANMSHEIRTPMTAVLGFADILLANLKDLESINAAKTIKRNGEFLVELINGILDLSKIEAGKLTVERLRCSPHQIVSDVALLMRVRSDAKGLPLLIEYEGEIPATIRSDPTRIRQILINLVGNAIKFSSRGEVRLNIRLVRRDPDDSVLQFDIVDQGIGMGRHELDKLFHPFMQADASTARKFGGTGLGLTISKRLAELLGGTLVCLGSSPDNGSTFRVTIATGPLDGVCLLECPKDAPAVERPTKPLWGTTMVDGHILLAEDSPDNQELVTFVLQKAGARVSLAADGQQALAMALAADAEGKPYDVILMDMQMPVLDGYAATRQLRARGYLGPIIALTAHAMRDDLEKCLVAGCDAYATKPIDGNLVDLIARHVARRGQPVNPIDVPC
jgi:signal transduction histidine kinase/ActR/RegA family two-component response regulator